MDKRSFRKRMTTKDYGYCKDCDMYFDLWKYGDIKSAGHEKCNWRYATKEELKELIENCIEDNCHKEMED